MAKRWGAWLILVFLLALLFYLGEIGFHQESLWPVFPVILLLVIILILLAFRKLRPKD